MRKPLGILGLHQAKLIGTERVNNGNYRNYSLVNAINNWQYLRITACENWLLLISQSITDFCLTHYIILQLFFYYWQVIRVERLIEKYKCYWYVINIRLKFRSLKKLLNIVHSNNYFVIKMFFLLILKFISLHKIHTIQVSVMFYSTIK